MAEDFMAMLGLDGASSPSPDTPPPSKLKPKKSNQKRSSNTKIINSKKRKRNSSISNQTNESGHTSIKRRKLSDSRDVNINVTTNKSKISTNTNNEPPPKKKKIGKKSKLIKLPTGITSSVLNDIDAELEEAYKQSVARKEKTKSMIKEIISDPSSSFGFTLDNFGEYAQSEPERSLSLEYKVNNPKPISHTDPNSTTAKRRSKIDKNKDSEYNPEAMEAVNAMLQSYENNSSYEQRSKSVDIQLDDKKKMKQRKTSKSGRSQGGLRYAHKKRQSRIAKRKRVDKREKDIEENTKSNNKDTETPQPKPKKKTKKAVKKEKRQRFVNILKMKAESAKKRKREGTQTQILDHEIYDSQIFGEEIDDIEDNDAGDDKFDLVYVPTTQLETQYDDDLIQINDIDNSKSPKISLPSTYASNSKIEIMKASLLNAMRLHGSSVEMAKKVARYSYFGMSILMIIGSFIHLNVMLETFQCRESEYISCIGRSLGWSKTGQLNIDSNAHWRQAFSLQPDVIIRMWTPMTFAFISFAQHFEGFRWYFISRTWFRTTCWLIFWSLFGIFGYASNWGVVMGFINCCWVSLLYLICTLIGITQENELPVLTWGSDVIRQHVDKFSFSGHDLTNPKPRDTIQKYLDQRGAVTVSQNQVQVQEKDTFDEEDQPFPPRDSTDAVVIAEPDHVMDI